MTTTYHTCPKCGEEIEFEVEYVTADDFQAYQAGMIATELQPDCKCSFTDDELEAMETEVSDGFNSEPPEPDHLDY